MNTIQRKKNPCLSCSVHIAKIYKGNLDKCKKCKERYIYLESFDNLLTNSDYNITDNHNVNTG